MLLPESIIELSLKVGVVYKIAFPEKIETNIPHYFIVIAITDDNNYLIVSTTQLQNKIDHIRKRGYHPDTLAYIPPNSENGLKQDSYFNCNEYVKAKKNELINKVQTNELEIVGHFSEEDYDKIVSAIRLSRVNNIPKFLLNYQPPST